MLPRVAMTCLHRSAPLQRGAAPDSRISAEKFSGEKRLDFGVVSDAIRASTKVRFFRTLSVRRIGHRCFQKTLSRGGRGGRGGLCLPPPRPPCTPRASSCSSEKHRRARLSATVRRSRRIFEDGEILQNQRHAVN